MISVPDLQFSVPWASRPRLWAPWLAPGVPKAGQDTKRYHFPSPKGPLWRSKIGLFWLFLVSFSHVFFLTFSLTFRSVFFSILGRPRWRKAWYVQWKITFFTFAKDLENHPFWGAKRVPTSSKKRGCLMFFCYVFFVYFPGRLAEYAAIRNVCERFCFCDFSVFFLFFGCVFSSVFGTPPGPFLVVLARTGVPPNRLLTLQSDALAVVKQLPAKNNFYS